MEEEDSVDKLFKHLKVDRPSSSPNLGSSSAFDSKESNASSTFAQFSSSKRQVLDHNNIIEAGRSQGRSHRPKAPIKKPQAVQSVAATKKEKSTRRSSLSKQLATKQLSTSTASLEESWDKLAFFNQHNLSRQLQNITGDSESIHFVNIDDDHYGEVNEDVDLDLSALRGESNSLLRGSQSTPGLMRMPREDYQLFKMKEVVETKHGLIATESTKFIVPTLPRGSQLVLNILSTHGDPYYLGLMGIEIFDHTGHLVEVDVSKVHAEPRDINVLDDYDNDPRTIDKLFDGECHTCDDLHSWLTPFTSGENHLIHIDLGSNTTISLLRIWNYNKSRIHSFRGARYVEITLDDVAIFKGEICKAPGARLAMEKCSECILFTVDLTVLGLIEKYDKHLVHDTLSEYSLPTHQQQQQPEVPHWWHEPLPERPRTAQQRPAPANRPLTGVGKRRSKPTTATATATATATVKIASMMQSIDGHGAEEVAAMADNSQPVAGDLLELYFDMNWGDSQCIGLTGLQLVSQDYSPVQLQQSQLSLSLVDGNKVLSSLFPALLESDGDCIDVEPSQVNLGALIDGHNNVTDVNHMWCAPFANDQTCYVLRIVLHTRNLPLQGLRFYNFNAGLDESYCGVKRTHIVLDGRPLTSEQGMLIRKAPGNQFIDFGQFIPLSQPPPLCVPASHSHSHSLASWPSQQYLTPKHPCGCILKFVLLNTHGDVHYVGLNGLEVYDEHGQLVRIDESNIQAVPRDITHLNDSANDCRTLDKLTNGVNDTFDDECMWLAPFNSTKPNLVFVFFDQPITVSKVLVWNYAKTPARGVREMELFIDDVLVFRGSLKPSPSIADCPDMRQCILFTDDQRTVEENLKYIFLPEEDHCVFIDEGAVIEAAAASSERPSTSAGARKRQ